MPLEKPLTTLSRIRAVRRMAPLLLREIPSPGEIALDLCSRTLPRTRSDPPAPMEDSCIPIDASLMTLFRTAAVRRPDAMITLLSTFEKAFLTMCAVDVDSADVMTTPLLPTFRKLQSEIETSPAIPRLIASEPWFKSANFSTSRRIGPAPAMLAIPVDPPRSFPFFTRTVLAPVSIAIRTLEAEVFCRVFPLRSSVTSLAWIVMTLPEATVMSRVRTYDPEDVIVVG